MNTVNKLKKMIDSGKFDIATFSSIIPILKKMPIVPIIVPSRAKIIRSSSNNDGLFHKNVSRLNYPPVEYAKLARANMDGEQMFYACIFNTFDKGDEEYAIPPRVVSAFETSHLFKDLESSGKMTTTQSLWLANRDLRLIVLPNSINWERPSIELKKIQEFINSNEIYRNRYTNEEHELAIYLGNLFAEPAHSCLYEITSRVSHLLLNDSIYSQDFDGIAYPSVKCGGVGFNICLKPSVVDSCIKFQGATLTMIIKMGMETTMFQIANSVEFPDGELKWKPTITSLKILVQNYGEDVLNDKNILE